MWYFYRGIKGTFPLLFSSYSARGWHKALRALTLISLSRIKPIWFCMSQQGLKERENLSRIFWGWRPINHPRNNPRIHKLRLPSLAQYLKQWAHSIDFEFSVKTSAKLVFGESWNIHKEACSENGALGWASFRTHLKTRTHCLDESPALTILLSLKRCTNGVTPGSLAILLEALPLFICRHLHCCCVIGRTPSFPRFPLNS